MRKVNIAIIGCGVVGSSLISQLDEKHLRIADEFGIDLRIPKVLVRNKETQREAPSSSILYSPDATNRDFSDVLTTDADEIINGDNIDLVIEVAGGIDDAYEIISSALSSSKSVVTANKALLALRGNELYALAEENGVDLLFEAAVGGGVPIIRPIRESLAVEHISSVRGILNGTTNFMLTQMTRNGVSYAEALAQAQALGYAEADPSADVKGHDAAAKIAIISLLATGANARAEDVQCTGITGVTSQDISTASKMGYVIKLIALVQEQDASSVFLRAEPTFVPLEHPFSTVHDGFNAVFIEGDKLGEAMFYGRGAGGDPTASAVLGDTIDAAINIANERKGSVVGFAFDKQIADPRDWISSFYVSAEVTDEPGVLSQIADVLAKHAVSVEIINQDGHGRTARLIFITHETPDGHVRDAVSELETLSCVNTVTAVYPIMS